VPESQQAGPDLVDEVVAVVRSVVPGKAAAVIEPGSPLRELGFDSVDLIELTVRLEERFQVDLGDADSYRISAVSDVVALIEETRAKADAGGATA
jgi:acyl carrier protein